MDTTRRKAKPLFVVWYDLRNAFGSIPQSFLWFVFSKLGVPEPFIQLLRDVYSDASTMVSTKDGLTQPIAQHCDAIVRLSGCSSIISSQTHSLMEMKKTKTLRMRAALPTDVVVKIALFVQDSATQFSLLEALHGSGLLGSLNHLW
ncbi:hypothetical protein LEN26_004696 [Aphanomyces euteiches]|nr:hypothetical protein LEN26_004696 [Aphanomyces euteiches]